MLEIPEHYEFGNQMFNANLPWLVPGAIHRLDSWLRPHMRVLEYGSGGSTIFFAARCVSVCSFEHSPEWYAKVNARIRELGLTNVDQRLVENDVECLKQIGELPDAYFDLVLVDGNGIRRGDFAVATLNKLAPGPLPSSTITPTIRLP